MSVSPAVLMSHSARQLMEAARQMTGITDIDDADIEEPLRHFLDALNSEAQLRPSGAEGMERQLIAMLSNRLRMLRDFRRHPEIADQPIVRPLCMVGGGRTGSTKLHKMLASSGDFLYMPCWQGLSLSLLTGDRNEDPRKRIEEAERSLAWFHQQAPEARYFHELSTFEPEEENLILAHALHPAYMMAFVFVPGYAQWWFTEERLLASFQFLKRGLQYLQWQFHDGKARPWLIKSPIYPGWEPVLTQVLPDATLVATHRHPLQALPSGMNLLTAWNRSFSDVDRGKTLGKFVADSQTTVFRNALATRDNYPQMRFLDIAYRDLTDSSERVVESVYTHAGIPLTDCARERMRVWEASHPENNTGGRRRSLEEFGVKADEVRTNYAEYLRRFGAFV